MQEIKVENEEIKHIAYYRLSRPKRKPGQTDEEFEAYVQYGHQDQINQAHEYIKGKENAVLIDEFYDAKSGSTMNRAGLQEALDKCKREKAILVVARLDRLARDLFSLQLILRTKIEIVFLDMPGVSYSKDDPQGIFQIQIMSAVAEQRRNMDSLHIRSALKVARDERNVKLGKTGVIRAQENKKKANEFAQTMMPVIRLLRENGYSTVQQITNALNENNIPGQLGGKWHKPTCWKLLKRIDELEKAA